MINRRDLIKIAGASIGIGIGLPVGNLLSKKIAPLSDPAGWVSVPMHPTILTFYTKNSLQVGDTGMMFFGEGEDREHFSNFRVMSVVKEEATQQYKIEALINPVEMYK